jgi:hypothetical protein
MPALRWAPVTLWPQQIYLPSIVVADAAILAQVADVVVYVVRWGNPGAAPVQPVHAVRGAENRPRILFQAEHAFLLPSGADRPSGRPDVSAAGV